MEIETNIIDQISQQAKQQLLQKDNHITQNNNDNIDKVNSNQNQSLEQKQELLNPSLSLSSLSSSQLITQKQDSIQVLIRVKPGQQDQCLTYTQTQIKLQKHKFAFDKIFPPKTTQDQIFDSIGHRLLLNTLDGYNGCIFAYGQTGSGKTHTMIGQNNGLMQKSFKQLFIRLNSMKNVQFFVTCSYFQIYNQQILDLLDNNSVNNSSINNQTNNKKKLTIRQDTKKGIFVQNLTQQTVFNSQKLIQCLYNGMKNRHVGQTQMNRQSSRSHSIFTISLSLRIQQNNNDQNQNNNKSQYKYINLKTPKLHFVDLAGSQRQKLTSATGDRLKQAGNINKSLTTLGMVINALTSDKPRTHIPYRDSKLTCLLRDSLGGNSKTFIIATIANSILCFQETLSTLNFANRAKMVKVRALINEQSLSTNIQTYKQEIKRLKAQIMRLKGQNQKNNQIIKMNMFSNKEYQYHQGKQFQNHNQIQNMNNSLDQHFHEINNKISVISQRLGLHMNQVQNQNQNQNQNRNNNSNNQSQNNRMFMSVVSPVFQQILNKIQLNLQQKNKHLLHNNKNKKIMQIQSNQDQIQQYQQLRQSSQNTLLTAENKNIRDQTTQPNQTQILMQYLSSNYQLLTQVNQKVNDYLHMKHQVRMALIKQNKQINSSLSSSYLSLSPSKNYNNISSSSQQLKSPLKQQFYDDLLIKKQQQKKQMEEDIHKIKDQLTQKQLLIFQLKQKLKYFNTVSQNLQDKQKQQEIYRQTILNKDKEIILMKSKLNQIQIDFKKSQNNIKDYQETIDNLKEMCFSLEQKFQIEKNQKEKLQNQIKINIQKASSFQKQIKSLKDKYTVQLQQCKSSIQTLQGNQQQLKRQINVLQQTVQFHQKKASQYSQKNKSLQISNQKLKKSLQCLNIQKIQIQQRIITMQNKILSMQTIINDLQNCNQKDIQKLRQSQNNLHQKNISFDIYKKQNQIQNRNLKNQINVLTDNLKRITDNCNKAVNIIKQNQNQCQSIKLQMIQLENMKNKEIIQLQQKLKQNQKNNQQLTIKKQQLQKIIISMQIKINNQVQQIIQQTKQLQQKQKILLNIYTIQQQNQQLKKSYQTIIKQNYKLKAFKDGKYQNSEQLFSKVQYYQEKFKLMSIQYKKATQSVKRLKQKQLEQSKIIYNLQQNVKIIKFNRNNLHLEQTIRILEEENQQLKKKVFNQGSASVSVLPNNSNTLSSNIDQAKIQKRYVQIESIYKKIQEFIIKHGLHLQINQNHQNHQNNSLQEQNRNYFLSLKSISNSNNNKIQEKSLEDLTLLWEKIETQTKKKLQCIAQGIQKQQKLKSQNNFILKQNIYLKEKLSSMEKEYNDLSGSKNPRKMIKLNQKQREKEKISPSSLSSCHFFNNSSTIIGQ